MHGTEHKVTNRTLREKEWEGAGNILCDIQRRSIAVSVLKLQLATSAVINLEMEVFH